VPKSCVLITAALCIGLYTGCSHALVFTDPEPIVILGNAPPAAPPPMPKPPSPAQAPKRVEVQEDKIAIHEKIQFDIDKATIKPASYGLLQDIVSVIASNPRLRLISIEGHTDSTASDEHNLALSESRAHAVLTYLVQHGISPERLVAKGWGESRPLASNATAYGREKNRRVEFIILDQTVESHTYEIDLKTGHRREVTPASPPASAPGTGELRVPNQSDQIGQNGVPPGLYVPPPATGPAFEQAPSTAPKSAQDAPPLEDL